MPLGPGIQYRVKNGIRLAFKGKKVVEAKRVQAARSKKNTIATRGY